jgi:hypothetical protein
MKERDPWDLDVGPGLTFLAQLVKQLPESDKPATEKQINYIKALLKKRGYSDKFINAINFDGLDAASAYKAIDELLHEKDDRALDNMLWFLGVYPIGYEWIKDW